MSQAPLELVIETVLDADITASEVTYDGGSVDVLVGSVYSEGTVEGAALLEVYAVVPETKYEAYQFSYGGTLQPWIGTSRLPIDGGTFSLSSIAAMVGTAPDGSAVILDVKKNGASVFAAPGDRPTILAGNNTATVGSWSNTTVTTGDYLSIDIASVGSTTPGSDLVVSIRFNKIA